MYFFNVFLKGVTKYDNVIHCRYGTQTVSRKSPRQFSIKRWNAPGARERSNGIRTHSYRPHGVIKAVRGWLSGLMNP